MLAISPPGWETPALARAEYLPTALARRTVELLDDLAVDRFAYVGFSWGATIGCHLAALTPERLAALVLLDAGYTDFQDMGQSPPSYDETVVQVRAVGRFESMDAYLAEVRTGRRGWRLALEARARLAVEERGGEVVVRASPEAIAAAFEGFRLEPPSSTIPVLAGLEAPILLVTASATLAEEWARRPLDRFRTGVPRADVRAVDSGHDLLADAPDETIELVGTWVRDVTIRPA